MKISELKPAVIIWSLPVLVPFFLILLSYIFDQWSWGLMDDLSILAYGSNIFVLWQKYFFELIPWGVFRPIFVLHTAIFYALFSSFVKGFYIFKLFEVLVILLLWGWAGYRITRKKIAFWIIPAIALSFHYFYDTLFYLSSHEFLGLLGVGLAIHCFISVWQEIVSDTSKRRNVHRFFIGGIFCLLFAFGSKETFVSSGMALGISLFAMSFFEDAKDSRAYLFFYGLGTMILTLIYAVGLKIFIQGGYTSNYHLTDIVHLRSALLIWAKKDLLNHLPWLIFVIWAWRRQKKTASVNDKYPERVLRAWGIVAGILLYLGFLAILLPWSTVSYYAAPLGLFFAFIVGLIIVKAIDIWTTSAQVILMIMTLALNVLVCSYALSRERTYQLDTYNLLRWFKANQAEIVRAAPATMIATNAKEPAGTIPGSLRREGVLIPLFKYQPLPSVNDATWFYLYSPRFGIISDTAFSGYRTEFVSKNWIMWEKRN